MGLLVGYLELLRDQSATLGPEREALSIAHVCDLLALTFGATRDAEAMAQRRGVRAARLAAIKQNIRENISNGPLSESRVAARQRVTPRYVQMLFEHEGTTFTEFVCNERLALARRMLASPRSTGRKIADIAYSCGFGDVSYFNRKFRQRFGSAPGELRKQQGCSTTRR
jgi:AraC-like DNA-binding protein